jgi:hypothetical protein
MQDDERCCGSGTCIIDPTGRCWCGQQWDGEKMVAASLLGSNPSGSGTEASHRPPASSVDAKVG